MMKKLEVEVLSSTDIALDTMEMELKSEYICKHAVPGQFLHIYVEGHTLRRPISIADVDKFNNTLTILFKKVGSGTEKLAAYQPGSRISVLGPSGNGFDYIGVESSTVLLVGGGIGVPPLYYLGKALAEKNVKVISVLGFQTGASVFYEEKFKQLGDTYIVTNDGSYGSRGFVTDVLWDIAEIDRYYSCGPLPMLKAVCTELPHKEGYISLEERMGCGVGACFACVIPTDDNGGYKKICKDGPVFAAHEVSL
ncbi:dihydroorotate dehydrogenase electron transfer subunit [Virgibacillus byunsanensis]|uniref:Dihydroorotate dehydrogenase B (NAD(+)), electron transfer subunit n=1 Tax=Virgibacillus byunsanensis TaxID=570945 RepID=A0ABW3LJR9_9BACI